MKKLGPAFALLLLPLLLVQPVPAFSGPSGGGAVRTASPLKSVRLVVVEAGGPGPAVLGFHVEPEPGWHLYWANPGDAGLAPSVRWTLPEGFTAGPLRHPVPRKTVASGLVSLEHEGSVLLLCEIAPPPAGFPGRPFEVSAVLEWMACSDGCVTGETEVRAAFPPEPASLAEGRSLLERFAPLFPRPLAGSGLAVGAARARRTGSAWLVEVTLSGPRAAEASDFFAYPVDGFVVDNAGVVCRDGKIVVPLVPSGGPDSPPPAGLGGLIVVAGTGYEVSAAVSRQTAPRPSASPCADPSLIDDPHPGLISIVSWR